MKPAAAIRTLYLLRRADDGPEALLLWHLLTHLPRPDVDIAICFLEDGPLTSRWALDLGVRTCALAPAGRRAGAARLARDLGSLLTEGRIHLLHAIGAGPQLVAARAARRAAIPMVWSQPGITQWGRLTDLRASLSPARAVLLHSGAGEAAQRRLFFRRSRCRRVTAGVSLPERLPEHRRADARAALGLESDALVAASLGPLDDGAAHQCFLQAAASLFHARPHARLLIAGTRGAPAAGSKSIAPRAGALGLDQVVTVVAPMDLPRALDAADIAVYDGAAGEPLVPMALLQALAAGVAVIAHDGPFLDEIVAPGTTAIMAPRGDPEALAVALLALADDPGRRHALAAAAARRTREHHDAGRMAEEVLALYREFLAA